MVDDYDDTNNNNNNKKKAFMIYTLNNEGLVLISFKKCSMIFLFTDIPLYNSLFSYKVINKISFLNTLCTTMRVLFNIILSNNSFKPGNVPKFSSSFKTQGIA